MTIENFFFNPQKDKNKKKMAVCPKNASSDTRVYENTKNVEIYIVYICNWCGCGFGES